MGKSPSHRHALDLGPRQHLQVVVAGKIDAEIPCQDFAVTQVAVHHHACGAFAHAWHTPGRITQMAARTGPAGPELAHHARESLRPVGGAKSLSFPGYAQDHEFFGGFWMHWMETTGAGA